jgi:hypothetical protein
VTRHLHGTSRRERDEEATTAAPAAKPAASEDQPEKKGWWEPIYAVPVGIAVAVPALHYEWLLITEETQVRCLKTFCFFRCCLQLLSVPSFR